MTSPKNRLSIANPYFGLIRANGGNGRCVFSYGGNAHGVFSYGGNGRCVFSYGGNAHGGCSYAELKK